VIARRNKAGLLALAFALALVAGACGDDDDGAAGNPGGSGGSGGGVRGSLTVTGSSTVEPISRAVADAFSSANRGVTLSVEGPGTGDGFERFCDGDADVTGASRAIREEEVRACEDAGVPFLELKVGDDGLTVATSTSHAAVDCLSFEQLYALLGPESTGFDNWSDANELAVELGGEGDLPDAPLTVIGPGEESGTYDFLVEEAIAPFAEERGEEAESRPDYQASPNDSVIVEGVQGSDTSLGWLGYAFYAEEQDAIKALEVDGGNGCVAPSPATIGDGTYPLSRPLFIYVNTAKASYGSAVAAFVDHYLSDEGLANVEEVGYVLPPAPEVEAARGAWQGR